MALGTALINLGLKDEYIAVTGKNSYNWAVSYLAATIIGIVVPIDKELKSEEIINFLNVSSSKAILGDDKYINEIEAYLGYEIKVLEELKIDDIAKGKIKFEKKSKEVLKNRKNKIILKK